MAEWFYAQGTTQHGPVPVQFLIDSLRSGALNAQDLVWRDGMAQWTAAGQVPELAGAFASAPPQPPQAQPAAFNAPVTPPQMAVPYGQPYLAAAPSQHSGLAITSLVLGILGLCCFGWFAAIPALICGIIALKGMKRTGDIRSKGMATAGVVLGAAAIAIYTILIIMYVFFIAAVVHNAPKMQPQHFPISPPVHKWVVPNP